MAQYKVPQDVEADDKLIGPFSFRQFVYLLIAGALIALAVGLFQIFPLLAIIPLPPVLLMLALALPLKKDQPMETYLAALVSYYLKPRKRVWVPGQRESTILITAPKIVEETRKRDLSEEEATHRLSFLANIVDTEGQAIKNVNDSVMRDDLAAEANTAKDMFDSYHSEVIDKAIAEDTTERRQEVIKEMRDAIEKNTNFSMAGATIQNSRGEALEAPESPVLKSPEPAVRPVENLNNVVVKPEQKPVQTPPKPSIMELANNPDFSVATIAKEANRINRKDEGEVFISLH
ncbi:PrgI family protein [Candidatus Saccharibacteria bacterium]|nr:PrgI family protein [Candidatus Saccharibacteria bacterium]